ncbi:LpqB family beta-propeller domain-containing protein [Nonomuraea sp. SBT364]|uniref:LpqB family beta-propeller domain-containing protein n=1 Tax=Nonomuraea sp. SBT364 TaxID=1580530 RepID=UPI00066D9958|nr:LpqB family beta-propeller domain-containing protein [Nonomuraea sp. SBT364]
MARTDRLRAAAVLAALAVLPMSGCAVIPVGGPFPIEEAGGGDSVTVPFQRMVAVEPEPGWSAQQVVEGLQAAMAAYADDPGILPKYLTEEARRVWKPDGPVTVIDNGFRFDDIVENKEKKETIVTILGTKIAQINEDDTYVPVDPADDNKVSRAITLVKDRNGDYRVNLLPQGLLLTDADVRRAYRSTNLYYLNGTAAGDREPDRLVADRVRLRIKATESFAETVVERVIQGPTSALQGAVGNEFPPGARVLSIRSSEDRVIINLAGPFTPSDTFREGLQAQLRASLSVNGLANGRSLEVQVEGEPFFTTGPLIVPANLPERWLAVEDRQVFYTSKGAVHILGTDGEGHPLVGPAGQPGETYSGFAISKDRDRIAALSTEGGIWVTRHAADGRWQQSIPGGTGKLTEPSWHRDGSLWTYDRQSGSVLRSYPSVGKGPEHVAAPALQGLDVTSLRMSRDGVRVAVRVGMKQVQVGALAGGGAGAMLSNFQTLISAEGDDEIRDIAWSDSEHLLVLVQTKAGQVVKEINVGDGETVQLPTTSKRLAWLAALGDVILATTEEGNEILEYGRDKQTWTPKPATAVDEPLFALG